jgi:capsular polysaccharide transport system permease protein
MPENRMSMQYLSIATVKSKLLGMNRLFAAAVVIPTSIAILYFGLIASDVYVSESHFVVRSPDKQSSVGLGGLLSSVASGFSKSLDDTHSVHDFMRSRDAMQNINKVIPLRTVYGQSDWFGRFNTLGLDDSDEALFHYYQKKIVVQLDSTSSISILNVRAYNAEDAVRINEQLLTMGEGLINKLNERGRQDLIKFASKEVAAAEERSKAAAKALSDYRALKGVVDPEKQSSIQLQQISKMQDELIATRTQLSQVESLSPDNPQIPALRNRITSIQGEILSETNKLVGGNTSLARKAAEYQRLALDREFADKQLASAMVSLEQARNDAQRKQLYLERIVQPSRPDSATEPNKMKGILTTLILGFVAWGILTILLAGIREHQN